MGVTDDTPELRPESMTFDNTDREQDKHAIIVVRKLTELVQASGNKAGGAKARRNTLILAKTVAINQLLDKRDFVSALNHLHSDRYIIHLCHAPMPYSYTKIAHYGI